MLGSTFDFLGFTHFWGVTRKGGWAVKRKTSRKRFSRALRAVNTWLKEHLHDSLDEQHQALSRKLRGHYGYYGITGNSISLHRFRDAVTRLWRKRLMRRRRGWELSWASFKAILGDRVLPHARCVHSVLSPAARA